MKSAVLEDFHILVVCVFRGEILYFRWIVLKKDESEMTDDRCVSLCKFISS